MIPKQVKHAPLMFQSETSASKMAALSESDCAAEKITDVLLQCEDCSEIFYTLESFNNNCHKCVKNDSNNNEVSDLYDDGVPIGPVCALVPNQYHRFIDSDTLKSYLVSNQSDATKFLTAVGVANIPVITHKRSSTIYPLLQTSLSEKGKEAVQQINNPWLINTLVDFVPSFENFLSSKPLSGSDDMDAEMQEEVATNKGKDDKEEDDKGQSVAYDAPEERTWKRGAVMLLLDQYKRHLPKFSDPKMKKRTVWATISQTLKENGYDIDSGKCERKIINMKSKYKSTKIHNRQSGNDPKTCSYFDELEDIFGKSPAICPVATCSSIKGIEKAEVISPSKETSEFKESIVVGTECNNKKSSKKLKTSDKLLKAFEDFGKKQEEREDRRMEAVKAMHAEQMEATNRFIGVFEKILDSK